MGDRPQRIHRTRERYPGGDDTEALQTAFDLAVEHWSDRAVPDDTYYDSWNSAYEAARTGLEDANDNGAEDSWLDNALPALDAISVVLSVAGVLLVVAACIVGGPFVLVAALSLAWRRSG